MHKNYTFKQKENYRENYIRLIRSYLLLFRKSKQEIYLDRAVQVQDKLKLIQFKDANWTNSDRTLTLIKGVI